ncbi:MAG: diguanylate cyclase [Betaproteobacteria bacterium]|nr:MAG: diguanylate cyclase [Betaproteobacteria bacterium]
MARDLLDQKAAIVNFHILRWFSGMVPDSKRLLLIIWPFLAIVILLVALAALAVDVLSAGRAYVGGEGLWSKGQKDAVYYLMHYTQDKSEDNYRSFQQAIAVPLGGRLARIEMEKRSPDLDVVRAGLIAGRTHEDDIKGVIRLYRTMRDISYMERVIDLWEAGDDHVLELQRLGEEMHAQIASGRSSIRSLAPLVEQVHEINARITPLSDEFSFTLGEANRALRRQLTMAIMIAAIVLIPVGVALSRRMLRRSEAFEKALRVSEERFKLAVSGTNDGIWDWNIVTGDVYYSPRFRQLLGLTDDNSLGGFELVSRMHHEDQPKLQAALQAHIEDREAFDVELRMVCHSGEQKWFRVRGQAVRDNSGTAVRMAGSLSDINEQKLADAQLHAEKERAVLTLASIGDAVITTDESGKVEFLNPIAEALTGWQSPDAKGMHLGGLLKITDESEREEAADLVDVVLRSGQGVTMSTDVLLVQRDGTEISVNVSAAPIRNRSSEIVGIVVVFHDVSHERHFAARLSYQASHDALTGLFNRNEFERRLDLALRNSSKYDQKHSLLYLDLDQFKIVNDTGGHAAGDELIRQISKLLRGRLRERDTLARLGGNEFGILLENCPPERGMRTAEEIRQSIKDFRFTWPRMPFTVGCSIGLVAITEGDHTLAEVLRAVDTACYVAKEKGRNRVHVYSTDDAEVSFKQGEMEWVTRIQKALEENRLRLYAQEIANLHPTIGAGTHYELLLRMLDAEGNLIMPGRFIGAAERYGLMQAIDRWVVTTAFETYAELSNKKHGRSIETCSINLSGASVGDDSFLEFLQTQAAIAGVPCNAFRFEITETVAVADLKKSGGLHSAAWHAWLPFLVGRFRLGHVFVRLLEALTRRLRENRRWLRQGHARRSDRPGNGRVDQPHRPCNGQEDHR